MEEPHRLHKEPAWGWVGELIGSVRLMRRDRLIATPVFDVTRRRVKTGMCRTRVAPHGRRAP